MLFSIANLLPRALSIHRWYRQTFPTEYPRELPGVDDVCWYPKSPWIPPAPRVVLNEWEGAYPIEDSRELERHPDVNTGMSDALKNTPGDGGA
ncbi:hypothetical protein RA989_21650, partial [Mycobacteroides abscessus subsp. massiliense]